MPHRIRACAITVLGLLAAGAPRAQGLRLDAEASLASELSERGIASWSRRAVAQGVLTVSDGVGWAASLALSSPLERGPGGYQAVARGSAYWSPAEDWQLQARLGGYAYPGGGGYRAYNRAEATLGAGFRDLASLELSAIRLNDDDGAHLYPALDLGLRWPLSLPLPGRLSLAGGVGRAELPAWPGTWYTYADAGLAWQAGPWRAALRHLGTSQGLHRLLGEAAEPRWVASVTLAFD
ncbi:MAG: hypothetical protein U1F53_19590 [Burkholderiaceae bacterium]